MLSFLYFDPYYFLYVGPFMLLALWAQWKVKGTFAKYAEEPVRSGITGAQAAQMILQGAGIHDVQIEGVPGMLADHYDPRTKTVRLSEDVLRGQSIAAVAVAAHEVGHAIQHAQAYAPMQWRSSLVPVVNIVSTLALPMFLVGIFIGITGMAIVGVVMFSVTTLFHLVTLPVEYDASGRAIRVLESSGMVSADQMVGVRKVLYAAGFTYLAATLVSAAELVYWLVRSGVLGGSRD